MSKLVREVPIQFRFLIAAATAALIIVPCSSGASTRQLHLREHRQVRSLHRHVGTLRFFRSHPRLARSRAGRRALRVARAWVPILRRELAETRAQLRPRLGLPSSWIAAALCVHSGWHYTTVRRPGVRPDYVFDGVGFWRTSDVPDSVAGGSGEGGWTATVGSLYGGGMSFMVGTWNRAARLSRVVPFVSSTSAIASQPPRVQLLATWLIVGQDGGSFREWPETSRACGLG